MWFRTGLVEGKTRVANFFPSSTFGLLAKLCWQGFLLSDGKETHGEKKQGKIYLYRFKPQACISLHIYRNMNPTFLQIQKLREEGPSNVQNPPTIPFCEKNNSQHHIYICISTWSTLNISIKEMRYLQRSSFLDLTENRRKQWHQYPLSHDISVLSFHEYLCTVLVTFSCPGSENSLVLNF